MNQRIIDSVNAELERARSKFPSNEKMLHAFVEEAGEVTREFLELHFDKARPEDVRKELIQVIAMAVRLIEEGDPEFPKFRFCHYKGCSQPMVGGPCGLCYE